MLIDVVKKSNNKQLSTARLNNKIVLQRYIDPPIEILIILDKIEQLIELNNAADITLDAIAEYISYNNQISGAYCQLEMTSNDSMNQKLYYYPLLSQVIEASCLYYSFCDSPFFLYPRYIVSNESFYAKQGEKIIVPITIFTQESRGSFEFEIFDTLNFKATTATDGFFTVETVELDPGNHCSAVTIYAKDVYTHRTENVAIIDVEYTIY